MTDESAPIYIVGNNPLAYFLAAKLTLANENVCLIAGRHNELFKKPVILKEDCLLQKNAVSISTGLSIRKNPKLVLLSVDDRELKSFLTYVSAVNVATCPVVSFCRQNDAALISDVIKAVPVNAYFDGFLSFREPNLVLLGRTPSVTISLSETSPNFELVRNVFAKTALKINFNADDNLNFWNDFCVYAACSLFSAVRNKNISSITKDNVLRTEILGLLHEIISLAPANVQLNTEKLISSIYAVPTEYVFPMAEALKHKTSCDINFIATVIRQQAELKKINPVLAAAAIKEIYRRLLTFVE